MIPTAAIQLPDRSGAIKAKLYEHTCVKRPPASVVIETLDNIAPTGSRRSAAVKQTGSPRTGSACLRDSAEQPPFTQISQRLAPKAARH
jgi:hypothetical protein